MSNRQPYVPKNGYPLPVFVTDEIAGTMRVDAGGGGNQQAVRPVGELAALVGAVDVTNDRLVILDASSSTHCQVSPSSLVSAGSLSPDLTIFRRKAASEGRATNVLADDATLQAPVGIGTWELSGSLEFTAASNAPDVQFGWGFTGGAIAAQSWSHDGSSITTTSVVNQPSNHASRVWGSVSSAGVTAATNAIRLRGSLVVTTPTTIRLQWAQNAVSAQPVTMVVGSYFCFRRVA